MDQTRSEHGDTRVLPCVLAPRKGPEHFQARYVLPVWRGWGLGLSYNHYRRNSHYKENPDVNKFLYEFRTSVTYAF